MYHFHMHFISQSSTGRDTKTIETASKKYKTYMTGKLNSENAVPMSMKASKSLAK